MKQLPSIVAVGLMTGALLVVPVSAFATPVPLELVSKTDTVMGAGSSLDASISPDGRYVAFSSYAANLVPGDGNDAYDAFVKDRQTGTIVRASLAADGGQGDQAADQPVISANGRYVAFYSNSVNLVPGDTNGTRDIFIKDLVTGAISRASTAADGTEGDSYSYDPVISADGRKVAFVSNAGNLVPDDTNGQTDVFVKDLDTGAISRMSTASDGAQAADRSHTPSISADGRYVAFVSYAPNLVAGDTNVRTDVFVKDRQTGEVALVSGQADGTMADQDSTEPSISADGHHIAFTTSARLTAADTNDVPDVFVRDLETGTVALLSSTPSGASADRGSGAAALSADGHYAAFRSAATNLVPGDTNDQDDVFRKDLLTGEVVLVSDADDGTQADGGSASPMITADGGIVAFGSSSTDLVPGDHNGFSDIFVRTLT
ncbi:MAG: hypothetical protein ABIQ18_47020 [Umezawaea sp.]